MNFASLKSLIYDEVPKTATVVPINQTPPVISGTYGAPPAATYVIPGPSVENSTDKVYQKLLSSTDPEASQALRQVFQLAKPLETVIVDKTQRLKAATAQALATGATPVQILDNVQSLFDALGQHETAFHTSLEKHTQTDVRDNEQRATALEQDIAGKQQSLRDLRTKIETTKAEIAHTETVFAGALARRRAELEQLKNEFTAILK